MSTVNPALGQTNYSYYKIPVLFTTTATYSIHRAPVLFITLFTAVQPLHPHTLIESVNSLDY